MHAEIYVLYFEITGMAASTRSGKYFIIKVWLIVYLHCNVGTNVPTYGSLIDLLEESEKDCLQGDNVSDILHSKFKDAYPGISIGRCKRFHTTVMRIAAPTRASLRGPTKLCGSPLTRYRKKKWIPRIRNPAGSELI